MFLRNITNITNEDISNSSFISIIVVSVFFSFIFLGCLCKNFDVKKKEENPPKYDDIEHPPQYDDIIV